MCSVLRSNSCHRWEVEHIDKAGSRGAILETGLCHSNHSIMHDQKLAEGEHYRNWWNEEYDRVRDELDYFTRYYAFVRGGVEDNTKDTIASLGASRTYNQFGTEPLFPHEKPMECHAEEGPIPAGFTGYENMHEKMQQMVDRFNKNCKKYVWGLPLSMEFKVIDHPYLLPPASGRTEWRNKAGELAGVTVLDIDCRKDGSKWVSTEWLGPGSGFFIVDIE